MMMFKNSHKHWTETESLKLWLLYDKGFPMAVIAPILKRSEGSLMQKVRRLKLNPSDRKKNRSRLPIKKNPNLYTEALKLINSVGFNKDKSRLPRSEILPAPKIDWQNRSLKKISLEKIKRNLFFRSFQMVINMLIDNGHKVESLHDRKTSKQLSIFLVNGKMKTPSQMLMMLNKERLEKGQGGTIYVEGYTVEQ